MKAIYLYRFQHRAKNNARDVLIAFFTSNKIDIDVFSQAILHNKEKSLAPDEIAMVVRDTLFASAISALNTIRARSLFDRLPNNLIVTLLSFDEYGKEKQRKTIQGEKPKKFVRFEDFKNRALTSIFRENDGFVNCTPAYHFQNPSGRHTGRFMRLSNALVSQAELSFFAFCALSFIPEEVKVIYIDTPALFSLIGSINDHLSGLNSKRHLLADNFRSYDFFKPPRFEFTRKDDALILISASSSGSLLRELIKREPTLSPQKIVHVVFLGKKAASHTSICNLQYDVDSNQDGYECDNGDFKAGSCPLCLEGSIAISLQGDQFDIAGPQPQSFLVTKADAPAGLSETIQRLANNEIFGISIGNPAENGCREFHVDPQKLNLSSKFKDRLRYILSRSIPAKVSCIVCADEASSSLADEVVKTLNKQNQPRIIGRNDLRSEAQAMVNEAVIICALVVESGRSLLDISRDLRSSYPLAPQIYIVGIIKSESDDRLKSLRATLVQTSHAQPHEFAQVEKILLPVSSPTNAWAKELLLLRRISRTPSLASHANALKDLKAREQILSKTSIPVVNQLFLPNIAGKELKLQQGFVFWPTKLSSGPHSQGDVFFTIASVLQALRSNSGKPGSRALISSRLQHTLLAPSNFGRFNDGIIQASFLRAARPHELNYASSLDDSREMQRVARRILVDSSFPRGEAAAEILIALATRHLNLCAEHLTELLAPVDSAPEIVQVLLAFCRLQLLEKQP
ncbi:MAG: hypothetical protein Q8Q73_07010 [Stagnimonas sp.]|nr:hypothetical protein [Stagnimonas sp.]